MNQKNRYLVTGGNGFLGIMLLRYLRNAGNKVYTLGKSNKNDLIRDLTKPFELPLDQDFDIIVHAAGKAHSLPRTEIEEREFFDVNFEGTKHLCNALITSGIKPAGFVFISTVAVYGLENAVTIKEDAPLLGSIPYAKSKILAEQWLQSWALDHNIKLAVLRLPLIAGPQPPGNLGSMIKGIKSGKYLSIGNAAAKKSVVWAGDVAKIIPVAALKGGIYNLTDGYDPTFRELEDGIAVALNIRRVKKIPYWFARLLALAGDLLGKHAPINSDKLRKITSTLTFDSSQALELLNWQPTPVLDKIRDMI